MSLLGMKSYDAYQHYPNIVNRLRGINAQLSASTSATIALIFKGKTNQFSKASC